MKKQLMPLQYLVEVEFNNYKNNSKVVNDGKLIDTMEDRLWMDPDKYTVCFSDKFDNRTYRHPYAVLSVCHKGSFRKINGGCEVLIKYEDNSYNNCTIEAIKVDGKVL